MGMEQPMQTNSVNQSKAIRSSRSYTAEQRAEILSYAKLHGPAKTSRHFGINSVLIYKWRKLALGEAANSRSVSNSERTPTRSKIDQARFDFAIQLLRESVGL